MKILITGSKGFIGRNLVKGLSSDYKITSISRNDFDLTDRKATNKFFEEKYFDIIIHTAITGGHRNKLDTSEILEQNLQMYYNLVSNKKHFRKLIHLDSGAGDGYPVDPYGLSKHIIRESIKLKDNFYNIKLYAVFGEDELNTRFIKSNIKRYINNSPIEIHQDRYMDFFYIDDLIKLIDYYILNDNLPKEINACYHQYTTLSYIAGIINKLSDYKVPIHIFGKEEDKSYTGHACDLSLEFIGLYEGIKQVYKKLKNENSTNNRN